MRYFCILGFVLLTGCGYDYNELSAAKTACANAGGQFSVGTIGTSITATYCSIERVRYRIGRTSYDFINGEQE